MTPKPHLTMEETVNDLSKKVNRIIVFLILSYIISFTIITTEWLNARETKVQFKVINDTFDTVQSNQHTILQQNASMSDSLIITNKLLRKK